MNYLLRGYSARSSWRSDPGLHARYHGFSELINRLAQYLAHVHDQAPPSFSSYSRAGDEFQQHCWVSGSAQLGTLLYTDAEAIARELHDRGHTAAAEAAVETLVSCLAGPFTGSAQPAAIGAVHQWHMLCCLLLNHRPQQLPHCARQCADNLLHACLATPPSLLQRSWLGPAGRGAGPTEQQQGRAAAVAEELREATAAAAALVGTRDGLPLVKLVVVVVQPVCHATQLPLTVLPQGPAAGTAGAVAAHMVFNGGSHILGLVAPRERRGIWINSTTQIAAEPDVLYATEDRAVAGMEGADDRAQAAGRAPTLHMEEVSLELSEGVAVLPDFNQHSLFLDHVVRAFLKCAASTCPMGRVQVGAVCMPWHCCKLGVDVACCGATTELVMVKALDHAWTPGCCCWHDC